MKNVLKQVLGVDVAQKELVVTLGRTLEDFTVELYGYSVFKNTEKGIKDMISWTAKRTDQDLGVRYVMEATGVYHQKMAYYLDDNGLEVSIVLPNKISNYMRTLDTKTITDKTCSEAIAQFGLERKLENWHRPKECYKNLQQLTRERDQIVQERTIVKNQLHAEKSEAYPHEGSLSRMKARIAFLNSQEKEIKSDIGKITKSSSELQEQIKRLTSIIGIGELTAAIVLAETNGFELIRNKRQLTSYAGLDVKEKQSGTSIKGKARISKKGNTSLRKAMYLPALAAVKWDQRFKDIYARIVSKHGIKMKGLVAIQRKLLEMMYTIFKNNADYDKEYLIKKNSAQMQIA